MNLEDKIIKKVAVVGVVGLGYVGLPLALEFAKSGYKVIGIDTDKEKVNSLLNGNSYITDVDSKLIVESLSEKKLFPTYDLGKIKEVDVVIICVPTPLRKTKEPDISYILSALEDIKRNFHKDLLIILESTTFPGTTEDIIKQGIEDLGYKVGKDFYLCFSPERVDPGNKKYKIKNTPKVVGGITPKCLELGCLLYSNIVDEVVPVSSTRVAEMVKLLENTFRAVNIGLINELAIMCEIMRVDIWEVIEAASTKPFGFMSFYPGAGIGGHCIPLDPQYLAWKAKSYGFYNRFIDLANDINENMPRYVVSKVSEVLNLYNKNINGSQILILGMAYKKDVNDIRESPSLVIYKLLKDRGAILKYNDPYIDEIVLDNGNIIKSYELRNDDLKNFDLVILCTGHSCYNYVEIAMNSKIVLDTRNAFKGIEGKNMYKLGAPIYEEDKLDMFNSMKEFNQKRSSNE